MAVHNLEVTTENLLNIIVQMPEKEFTQFVEKAKKLRTKSAKSNWTKRDIEQIKKLNECVLSPQKQRRYNELVEKRRNEFITDSEMEELITLTDETEELNVKRLRILVKLSLSKNKSLDEIMKELNIRSPQTI